MRSIIFASLVVVSAFGGGYITAQWQSGEYDAMFAARDRFADYEMQSEHCVTGHVSVVAVGDQLSRDAILLRRAGCQTTISNRGHFSTWWYNPVTGSHTASEGYINPMYLIATAHNHSVTGTESWVAE